MIGIMTDWKAAPAASRRRAVVPLLALLVWLGGDQHLSAADGSFPRGPGFYYHPLKLTLVLAFFFCWVSLCGWVDRDVRKLGIASWVPNALILIAGLGGLVIFWLAPTFMLGFPLLLGIVGGTAVFYVQFRNRRVEPAEQVMTERHVRALLRHYLKFALPAEEGADQKARLPVRFIGRTDDPSRDNDERVKKIQESKGYQGALEMVYKAVRQRATDIHLEPAKSEMAVRLRIDGIMTSAAPFSRAMGDAVVNIFKVLCNMDITEKRKPQDGGFSAQIKDHVVDFRVATAGSVIGEKMVLRILDKSQQIISLTRLGMRDKMRDQVRALIGQPHGMFLVCGPTGAGKSTTLYACLNEIDRFQQNIITLENPVEFQLANVTQIEVNPKAGKTFASELRSILRQDPDIIMIGEIRDEETAEIACQAAQTGHFVFSTLHANDTVTAVGRLIDLGVAPFMIAGALTAVLGQRLVRQLCPGCKVRYKPNPDLLRKANLPAEKIKYFYRPPDEGEQEDEESEPVVCDTCGGTGYYKRTGIFELLVISDRIRDLIRADPNLNAIRQEAIKEGMRYIYEDGLRKVLEGETSIQELLRVSK
jgi:general secretion pathway protein E